MKNKNYSEILKQAIKNSGYTQKQLAEKIGESQQTVSNWLNRNDVSLLSFIRICEGIEINPASIFVICIIFNQSLRNAKCHGMG